MRIFILSVPSCSTPLRRATQHSLPTWSFELNSPCSARPTRWHLPLKTGHSVSGSLIFGRASSLGILWYVWERRPLLKVLLEFRGHRIEMKFVHMYKCFSCNLKNATCQRHGSSNRKGEWWCCRGIARTAWQTLFINFKRQGHTQERKEPWPFSQRSSGSAKDV